MKAATIAACTSSGDGPLPIEDKLIIAPLAFLTAVALTLKRYWLMFHPGMESRTDLLARMLALYWPTEYTYRIPGYPVEKSFALAVESVNTLVTPWLSLLLVWAILKHKRYRYALQFTSSTYTFYATFLYYFVAHRAGYAVFEYRGIYIYLMFYLANLQWLAAFAWIGCDAYRGIVRGYDSA